jgi:2-polyprenyl-3-methyl-5-hydroxy-6-metoxy-1,4-benzoquinol methylase
VRLTVRPGGPLEWLALRANLAPVPAAESWGGMAVSSVLVAAARLGMLARLARGPVTADQLAAELGLAPVACRMILDCLHACGHLRRRGDGYELARRSRRWLDPASPQSVTGFLAATHDYWPWWSGLAEVARTGPSVDHHEHPAEGPYWRTYLTGLAELARLVGPEVIRAVRLPRRAHRLLDVGGGHGWYAAELCRRHPQLRATVLDLPGAARIGRELVARAGLADRVDYLEGDALHTEPGGPYDAVLCFNLLHHLGPAQARQLVGRMHAALAPGGSIALLDVFGEPSRRPGPAAFLSLFVHLSSGAQVYETSQLHGWLAEAGFGPVDRRRIWRMPGLTLHQARRR